MVGCYKLNKMMGYGGLCPNLSYATWEDYEVYISELLIIFNMGATAPHPRQNAFLASRHAQMNTSRDS